MALNVKIITNLDEEPARLEDTRLAELLSENGTMKAETLDIRDAAQAAFADGKLKERPLYVLRNVYPTYGLQDKIQALQSAAREGSIQILTTPRQNGRIADNKTYFQTLIGGQPHVPETWIDGRPGPFPSSASGKYVIKPLNGCSSAGFQRVDRTELEQKKADGLLANQIVQHCLSLQDERSLFFIDNRFIYATKTRNGPGPDEDKRWSMEEYDPSANEHALATHFNRYAARSPGQIVRIDFGATTDGNLWLMELEDLVPHLSFDCISDETQHNVAAALSQSLEKAKDILDKRQGKPFTSQFSFFKL